MNRKTWIILGASLLLGINLLIGCLFLWYRLSRNKKIVIDALED